MTNIRDKGFWKNEREMLRKYFEKVKKAADQQNIEPSLVWECLEPKYTTLELFFTSKILSMNKIEKLESEVRDLGYSPDIGIKAWFRKKLEEAKKTTRERAKQFKMDKQESEMASVKRFYKNEGRCFQDLGPQPENSPVDVIAVEGDKKIPYQVTYLERDVESQLGKWGSYEVWKKTPEELRKIIEEVVGEKELKGAGKDIILLLIASNIHHEDRWEEAIRGLSINSSFKKIYIVTHGRNFLIWPLTP